MILKTLSTACLLLVTAVSALAAPQVAAPESSFVFGNLYQGEKATHIFTFSNSGDAPLIVEKVRSSCGCTAAMASKKTLQPGESGEVKATFDSTRFRGPIAKKVYLYTNDPKQKSFEFKLTATVKEVIVRKPHRISAGPIPPGKLRSDTIELTNQWNAPLTINTIESGLEQLKVTLDPMTLAPGEKGQLKLDITPGKEKRRINSYVILNTDNMLLPEIRIPVFYLVNLGG